MFACLTAGLSEDVFQALSHPSLVRVLFLAALHPQSDHLLDAQQSPQQVFCATKNKIKKSNFSFQNAKSALEAEN